MYLNVRYLPEMETTCLNDAMPVHFDQHCFNILLNNHTKAVNFTTINMKNLPNIVILACVNMTKTTLLKKVGPQIWFCLCMCRPITFKQ